MQINGDDCQHFELLNRSYMCRHCKQKKGQEHSNAKRWNLHTNILRFSLSLAIYFMHFKTSIALE